MNRSTFATVVACFFAAGCSHALLDKTQTRVAKARAEQLKVLLPQTYAQMRQESMPGALIVFDGQAQPLVATGKSPPDAFRRLPNINMSDSASCVFAFPYEAAIAPMELSCAMIKDEMSRFSDIATKLLTIQSDLAASRGDITKIKEAIREYDQALTTSFRMGLINSDLLAAQRRQITQLSAANSASTRELRSINDSLSKLIEQFNSNTAKIEEAIAKLPK